MEGYGCTIDIAEIIKETCSNVDTNMLMSALIISSAMIFYVAIIPRARQIITKFNDSNGMNNLFDIALGLCETLVLMGSLYIVAIHFYKGMITTTMWAWFGFIGFLTIIAFLISLPESILFIKNIFKNIKESKEEEEENSDDE